jgi:hypothetical protein
MCLCVCVCVCLCAWVPVGYIMLQSGQNREKDGIERSGRARRTIKMKRQSETERRSNGDRVIQNMQTYAVTERVKESRLMSFEIALWNINRRKSTTCCSFCGKSVARVRGEGQTERQKETERQRWTNRETETYKQRQRRTNRETVGHRQRDRDGQID